MIRTVLFVLVAAVGFLLPSRSHAQSPGETRDAQARHLFEAGAVAFDSGRYEDALAHFQEAYELSGRAQLLYNLGQAADRLRRDRDALDYFQRFLREGSPEGALRAAVERRVALLHEAVESARAAEQARPPVPSTIEAPVAAAPRTPTAGVSGAHSRPSGGTEWWIPGWITLGLGGVSGVVSGVMYAVREGRASRLNGPSCDPPPGQTVRDVPGCAEAHQGALEAESGAIATLAIASALVLAGTVFLVLAGLDSDDAPRAACGPGPGEVGIACGVRF